MASAVIDTGYAWIVCTASFMVLTVIGVFTNAQGIFYIMYKHGIEASDSSLTLITSLNTSAIYIVGPFVGLLTAQFGERPTAILGAVMATGGLACSAFSTQVYHLYISFSLVTGFGLGIVLNPCITILDVYFLKHKRVAYGLVSTGYGVSSFIMPPILKLLEDVYGWRGAILMMAGIAAHLVLFSCLYKPLDIQLRPRTEASDGIALAKVKDMPSIHMYPSKNQDNPVEMSLLDTERQLRQCYPSTDHTPSIDLSRNTNNQPNAFRKALLMLRITSFLSIILLDFIINFPMIVVFTHFGNYVLTLGFTHNDAVLLYTSMGIASTVIRSPIAYAAQVTKANPFALIGISIMLLGISTMLLPLTNMLPLLYLYAVSFRLLLAVYNVLQVTTAMESVPHEMVPVAVGIVHLSYVPGTVLGAPLSAWVYNSTDVYAYSFYFAGVLFLLSSLTMIPSCVDLHKQKPNNTP